MLNRLSTPVMEVKNASEDEPHFLKTQASCTTIAPSSSVLDAPTTEATFFSFSRLPIELRTKIWKLQIPPPRIIKLTYYLGTDNEIIEAPVLATPLLHTCYEARKVASEFYEIGFEGCKWPAHPIYVDWNRDTIWLERGVGRADYNVCSMDVPRPAFDVAWQSSVRHLAISSPRGYVTPFTRPWKLDDFGGLETLTLEVIFYESAIHAGCNIEEHVFNQRRRWANNASIDPDGHWPKIQFVPQGAVKKIVEMNKVSLHVRSFISILC
jgi:hypothetical protein